MLNGESFLKIIGDTSAWEIRERNEVDGFNQVLKKVIGETNPFRIHTNSRVHLTALRTKHREYSMVGRDRWLMSS